MSSTLSETSPLIPDPAVGMPAPGDALDQQGVRSGPSLPPSIRLRYGVTLFSQFLQLALSVVTAGLLPKALGPVAFGNYSFILSMSTTIRNFTDLGAQQTFFTFSSQKTASGGLTKLYGLWLLFQFVISMGLIALSALTGRMHLLWPGQAIDQILLVTSLEWLIFLAVTLRLLGDTKGLTVRTQLITAATMLMNTVAVLLLAFGGRLNFYSYAGSISVITFISCLVLAGYLLVSQRSLCWDGPAHPHLSDYMNRWKKYASPLVVWGLYNSVVASVDTYFIQHLYGSSEQAFLSLATKWSSLVVVFTTSVLTIYWRELANSVAEGNSGRASHIYVRFNRLLFFLAVCLAFWLSMNAGFVISRFAGMSYAAAVPVLMIMAFYPVAQTTGQLSSTALLASERTQLYRNLGMALSIPNLALSYLVLAPKDARIPGLGLGALGVAIKLVCFSLVSVNLYDWLNYKYFKLNWAEGALKMYSAVLWVGPLAYVWLVSFQQAMQLQTTLNPVVILALSSLLYFGVIGGLITWKPGLVGLDRHDFTSGWESMRRFFRPSSGV